MRASGAVAIVVLAAVVGLPQVGWAQPAVRHDTLAAGQTRYVSPGGHDRSNACSTQANPCRTLGHALVEAASGDTIDLAAGTYREHDLVISKSVTIVGAGSSKSSVDAAGAGAAFVVESGVTVTMTCLAIVNGATSDHGGAVTNSGSLTITHSRMIGNSATDPGGAITNYATIGRLTGDVFANNTSESNGGAIENFGTIGTVSRDVFRGNRGGQGAGAVDNDGEIGSITYSSFEQNVSAVEAGAVVNDESIGDVSYDTFAHNTSTGGIGGALENIFGTVNTLTNDTFAFNTADGELSEGGAILLEFATVDVMADDTIIDNRAAIGGGLDSENAVIGSISGVILAMNRGKQGPNCYQFNPDQGSITDAGHNLLGDTANTCGFSADLHDLIDVRPGLRQLGHYGRTRQTAPPARGSPVIDAGGPAPCPTETDEIGTSRPVGAACDIGSIEYDARARPVR